MKILGIDYGRKKIGLALVDTSYGLVEPLYTLPILGLFKKLSPLTSEYQIEKIVLGNPGGSMEKEIKEFREDLQEKTGLEVELFDETLTTFDAQKLLIESGKNRKTRKEMEDAIAAAIMLELYIRRF
jgi:putative Holliday junction resolvase